MANLTPAERRDLVAFLNAWLRWVEDGAEPLSGVRFSPHAGLCDNARRIRQFWPRAPRALRAALGTDFGQFGAEAPFNFNVKAYLNEPDKRLNSRRLAWVRKTLATLSPTLTSEATPKLIELFASGEGHYERADGSEFHLRWLNSGTCKQKLEAGWYWWNVALMNPCCPSYKQVGEAHGPYLVNDRAFRAAVANDPEASDA